MVLDGLLHSDLRCGQLTPSSFCQASSAGCASVQSQLVWASGICCCVGSLNAFHAVGPTPPPPPQKNGLQLRLVERTTGVNGAGGVQGATTVTGTRRFQTDCSEAATSQSQWLRSLSFDAARGRLLMMTGRKQHDEDSGFSLVSAPACHECDNNGTDIYQYFTDAIISPPQFKVFTHSLTAESVVTAVSSSFYNLN